MSIKPHGWFQNARNSHRMIERNKLPNAVRLAKSCVQMFPLFANYHIPKRL